MGKDCCSASLRCFPMLYTVEKEEFTKETTG